MENREPKPDKITGDMTQYNFQGHYHFEGIDISQEGFCCHRPDGKVIGMIHDEFDDLGFNRLLLGVYLPERGNLSFLKLTPLNAGPGAILYSMNVEYGSQEDHSPLTGSYDGFWISQLAIPLIGDLEKVLSVNKFSFDRLSFGKLFDGLEELSAESLSAEYFNPVFYDFQPAALKEGQTARLSFSKF